MSSVYTKLLFVCLMLQLTNIIANADSPKIRWSNTNKTIAPDMIQVSEDGNYLHTLQKNYYKKIDLNTDSIVKVFDLNQVCSKAINTLIEFDGSPSIEPQYYFNYPNITLLFRAGSRYIVFYNIETEAFYVIGHQYGINYMISNENYTIFYYFNIVGGKDGSFRSTHIFLWDYKNREVRQIFLSNSDKSIAVSAGLFENDKYWTYTSSGGFQIFNAENDSLLISGFSAGIDTYFNAYYKMDDDVIYFLSYNYEPTGRLINLKTMKSEFNKIPYLPSLANPMMNLRYKNYIGYYSTNEMPIMTMFDFKSNTIINVSKNSSYFRAFDIDTTKGILYYITENDPSKIFCRNLKDSTIEKVISLNLPVSDFKIGKEIITHNNFYSNSNGIGSKLFTNYSLLNKESGSELSSYKIDTLKLRNNYGNFFYDSLTNNFYPIFFNGSNYSILDYHTKQIINISFKNYIIPYYYKPSGVYFSSKILNSIDILNGKITDKIDFKYDGYYLIGISRNGRQLRFSNNSVYSKNYYFYDLNEKKEYKYPWYDYSANHLNFIGNSGNFITQNGKQVILRNFKNPQDTIDLGINNSIITTSTFTKNERMIITGDISGKITFWNILTKTKYYEIDLNMDIKKIDLTLDEKGLLVLTGDGSLTMLDVDDILLTDVEEILNVAPEFIIYPNPATEYITINLSAINPTLKRGVEGGVVVEIYDVMGIKIQTITFETQNIVSLQQRIDISNLASGVYFLKIGGSNGAISIVEKFVKY